jgi:glycosyltransferase involved in cell wall biosynthesis
VTIGNYPRKIDEYFAMGKPVVATYTEAMRYFLPYVSLATNQQEWVQAVEMELSQDSNDKAIEREVFAGSHTWTNNVQEIYKYIDQQ